MKDGLRRYGLMLLSGTEHYSTNVDFYQSEEAINFSGLQLSDRSETEFSTIDNGGQEYIVISSWNNARWFVPNKKDIIMHVGNIIKPSSFMSRFVWDVARVLGHIGHFNKVFRTKVYLKTTSPGQLFLDNYDIEKDFIIYTGSRGLWQKFTIQEMKDREILSFTKVGKHDLARQRIENEGNILKVLNDYKSIKGSIPNLISFYERNSMTFLKQSPCPCQYNQVIDSFGEQHKRFLKKLSQIKKTVDAEEYMDKLKDKINNSGYQGEKLKGHSELLDKAFKILRKKFVNEETLVLYMSHGDFSQWNMYSDGYELFVFDWEMGAYRCPLWDYFNFIYHKNLLIDRARRTKLEKELLANKQWAENFSPLQYEQSHLLFLMEIIVEYCHQNKLTMAFGLSTNGDQLVNYFFDALKRYVENDR